MNDIPVSLLRIGGPHPFDCECNVCSHRRRVCEQSMQRLIAEVRRHADHLEREEILFDREWAL